MNRNRIKQELSSVIEQYKYLSPATINDIMNGLRNKPIIIYGAGSFGQQMFTIFKEYSINVEFFLDISAKEGQRLFDIPVYRPCTIFNKEYMKNAIVVLAIVLNNSGKNKLIRTIKSYGFNNVIYAQEIRCHFTFVEDSNIESPDYQYYENKKAEILYCVDLWADETSVQIYKENLVSHICRDYSCCLEMEDETQYFLTSIDFNQGYSRFIDCGAYIGDTIQALIQNKGKVEAVAAFEPESVNFLKLRNYADQNSKYIADDIFLHPFGVGEKTEMVGFKTLGGSSCISKHGSTHVQCVAIDDVLKNFNPTFIKMDVEGAEYNALLGAKNTIHKHKPDLAISVYHYINHLWDIPLLLNRWDLNYKFYLRSHSACTMETIMYATST